MSDESWRGEEEGESSGIFGMFHMMRPPTPEETAERERRIAEGDLRYLTLPPYRPGSACVKCGHTKARTRHSRGPSPEAGHHDSMVRDCKRCGYSWVERPLDCDVNS